MFALKVERTHFLLPPPQLQHWPAMLVLLNFAQVASQLPAPVLTH